ncbi:NAD(P)(+) transhydrogenase (Re/Si-specific) subunit beta [Glaciecola sp. HTCC2999]|jgi:NAD(P) transhydrogenase subunit beta|uniref:NAD(P)(+) transhydrogenase (Re/Si-specific) subunit beta n=1 Tax=Glaciecola sp. HTCC2999 TaxID=455436 RepID=UPI0000E0EEBF|nr:NAD(P)(+) transhydrogenase (Re/Si-specific) subunit beta [Glaciecola sp. HTCC2999]
MDNLILINIVYVIAAALFIFGLKLLGNPATARKGNMLSGLAMLVAIIVTLMDQNIVSYGWIMVSILAGSAVGVYVSKKVEMTGMPELVSLFNGVGGLASAAVAIAAMVASELSSGIASISVIALIIGSVTFSGSLVAWGKLSERVSGKPIVFNQQAIANYGLIAATILFSSLYVLNPSSLFFIVVVIVLALAIGVMVVLPIGGADMPVVISLLNSYSGLAACAAGFALENNLLIVAGALVGASGIILTNIMCKAMNRSLINVLTSGFQEVVTNEIVVEGEIKPISAEDAFYVFEAAQSILVIPGYGMAVAQAQHAMKELQELLEKNDAEVVYGIHPVAGRMPGHMNVLLAEADVSYDLLLEMDEVNPRMENFDIAIVIGANDVVNPAARELEGSPIYGMPVINADLAKNVFVIKRSMSSGFAGVDNPLFFKDNTRMIFGDAKEVINNIVRQFND